jgi:hypothetical protein
LYPIKADRSEVGSCFSPNKFAIGECNWASIKMSTWNFAFFWPILGFGPQMQYSMLICGRQHKLNRIIKFTDCCCSSNNSPPHPLLLFPCNSSICRIENPSLNRMANNRPNNVSYCREMHLFRTWLE